MDSQIKAELHDGELISAVPEPVLPQEAIADSPQPLGLRRLFLGGGILLGFAVALQRLFSFVATALVARIGGASVLGEYSVALSTAGMVSGFVGVGVGTVALRYMGQFPRDSRAYRKVLRLVIIIAAVAAVSSTLVLFLGSEFAARFILNNGNLTPIFRIAALASLAFVLVEALNGVLIGHHNFRALLWLSSVSGLFTILAVVFGARYGASTILLGFTGALLLGILVTAIKAWGSISPLPFRGLPEVDPPRTRDVLLFGNVQQINTIVLALTSWWVIVTVARFDPSLREMGFYVVGSQLRVLASQAPTLAGQLVFPTLARTTAVPEQQDRVISVSTFLCVSLSLMPAGMVLIVLPWILNLYGVVFQHAAITCSILVATAVVQLTYIPAANAVLMLSLKTSVLINMVWALVLASLALILSRGLGASGGALAWLLSQVLAQGLVLGALRNLGRLPSVIAVVLLGDFAVIALGLLALIRAVYPSTGLLLTSVQCLLFLGAMIGLFKIAQLRGYLPGKTMAALGELKSAPAVFLNYLASTKTA